MGSCAAIAIQKQQILINDKKFRPNSCFPSFYEFPPPIFKGASLTDLSAEVKILYAIRLRDQSVISRKAGVKLSSLEVPFNFDHEGRGL